MDDGQRISAETFRRLACDCSLLGVVEVLSAEPPDLDLPVSVWLAKHGVPK